MTTVDGRHEIDREAERLAYKPPEIRHDKQGDMADEERINKAMHHFVKNFNTQTASYLDGCLHCGMCADACHFHVRTDDPRYTPIWKIELFKRTYKRQVGPFAFFYMSCVQALIFRPHSNLRALTRAIRSTSSNPAATRAEVQRRSRPRRANNSKVSARF